MGDDLALHYRGVSAAAWGSKRLHLRDCQNPRWGGKDCSYLDSLLAHCRFSRWRNRDSPVATRIRTSLVGCVEPRTSVLSCSAQYRSPVRSPHVWLEEHESGVLWLASHAAESQRHRDVSRSGLSIPGRPASKA